MRNIITHSNNNIALCADKLSRGLEAMDQLTFYSKGGQLTVTADASAEAHSSASPLLKMTLPVAPPTDPVPDSCCAGSEFQHALLGNAKVRMLPSLLLHYK